MHRSPSSAAMSHASRSRTKWWSHLVTPKPAQCYPGCSSGAAPLRCLENSPTVVQHSLPRSRPKNLRTRTDASLHMRAVMLLDLLVSHPSLDFSWLCPRFAMHLQWLNLIESSDRPQDLTTLPEIAHRSPFILAWHAYNIYIYINTYTH